jgi:SAM-dependent methyltransferase
MAERRIIDEKARTFFEELWKRGDPWELESSEFEQAKYARQLAMVNDRRYTRVLEIGCGAGRFTQLLSRTADRVVAIDVAPTAIGRAQAILSKPGVVDFSVANIMDYDARAEGPWDLIVMSETIYYLGWLYPFFDVAWLATELFAATRTGGRLLMANTQSGTEDHLLHPWLIHTYRDLFLNVGYLLEAQEIFRGSKNGVELEALISLFVKDPEETEDTGA